MNDGSGESGEFDPEVEDAIASMAALDRQELRVELADPSTAIGPLSERRAEQILGSIEALSQSPAPRPWRRRVGVIAAAVGAAAAAVLVWGSSRSRPADAQEVGPMEVQLGGTSRILGSRDPEPRAYGPGDDFVLRLVPRGWDPAHVRARLSAHSSANGARQLDWTPTHAADGAIEFRGRLDTVLAPGLWVLRAEVGRFEACEAPEPATRGQCSAMEAEVELVSD